jgi:hypothetical protein
MLNRLFAGALAAVVLSAAAYAIQPGTTGTNKQYQQEGFRTGVLIQRNNTATASAGAATLNQAGSGVITSEALVTTAGSTYTLTLTNNMIEIGDVIVGSAEKGTSTAGDPQLKSVSVGAGTAIFKVRNSTDEVSAAFNGTIKVKFLVIKQSANGSD